MASEVCHANSFLKLRFDFTLHLAAWWSDTLEKNHYSGNYIFLSKNKESNVCSTATSEFDEFGQSEQTGFKDDNDDANNEILDNHKGNRKVYTSLLLILTIQNVN